MREEFLSLFWKATMKPADIQETLTQHSRFTGKQAWSMRGKEPQSFHEASAWFPSCDLGGIFCLQEGHCHGSLCSQGADGISVGKGGPVPAADGPQLPRLCHWYRFHGVGNGSCRVWEGDGKLAFCLFLPAPMTCRLWMWGERKALCRVPQFHSYKLGGLTFPPRVRLHLSRLGCSRLVSCVAWRMWAECKEGRGKSRAPGGDAGGDMCLHWLTEADRHCS